MAVIFVSLYMLSREHTRRYADKDGQAAHTGHYFIMYFSVAGLVNCTYFDRNFFTIGVRIKTVSRETKTQQLCETCVRQA